MNHQMQTNKLDNTKLLKRIYNNESLHQKDSSMNSLNNKTVIINFNENNKENMNTPAEPAIEPSNNNQVEQNNQADKHSFNEQEKKSRRSRTTFTKGNLKILNQVFENNKFPDQSQRHVLAELIRVPTSVITIWFKNRRAKDKFFNQNFLDEQKNTAVLNQQNNQQSQQHFSEQQFSPAVLPYQLTKKPQIEKKLSSNNPPYSINGLSQNHPYSDFNNMKVNLKPFKNSNKKPIQNVNGFQNFLLSPTTTSSPISQTSFQPYNVFMNNFYSENVNHTKETPHRTFDKLNEFHYTVPYNDHIDKSFLEVHKPQEINHQLSISLDNERIPYLNHSLIGHSNDVSLLQSPQSQSFQSNSFFFNVANLYGWNNLNSTQNINGITHKNVSSSLNSPAKNEKSLETVPLSHFSMKDNVVFDGGNILFASNISNASKAINSQRQSFSHSLIP